jgi:hypothetical protein
VIRELSAWNGLFLDFFFCIFCFWLEFLWHSSIRAVPDAVEPKSGVIEKNT